MILLVSSKMLNNQTMHFITEGFFSGFCQSVHDFRVTIKATVRSPVSRKLELFMYHRKIWKFFKIVVKKPYSGIVACNCNTATLETATLKPS